MPESKKRKPRKKVNLPQPNKAVPKKHVLPKATTIKDLPDAERFSRNPAKPIPEDKKYTYELPEPASYDQVLVALADMDAITQEVMIAQRLAAMPHPGDPENNPPIHIERLCRAPWAHNLRKLGIFCIPELATHELVAPDNATGAMVNHTASSLRKLEPEDLWEMARKQNPALGKLVDEADTPEKKEAAMKKLAASSPVNIRVAMQRLVSTRPEEMEPT